ncbi:MAG: hypothetical protein HY909_04115 [Deltaproteobacteria bacterium]|nr:hypothetical protein [Deltaproteobacteria bacterium]
MKNASSDRLVAWFVVVTAAVVIFLLGLDRFGIWQPAEIRVADMAREVAAHHPVVLDRPPAQVSSVALGFRLGRTSELFGRLPGALLALLATASLMAAARGAGDRRLAIYTGLAYTTLPLVYLNARQMFGGGIAQSATTVAFSGVVLLAWGQSAVWRRAGAALAALGLALAVAAAGVMLGVVPVLGALGLAVLLRASRETGTTRLVGAGAFVGAAALAAAALKRAASGDVTAYSPLVGAGGGAGPSGAWLTFETYIEQVGHAAFPWTGFLPFGLVRLVSPPSAVSEGPSDAALEPDEAAEVDAWRESGLRLTAFLMIALGFALQTFHMQLYGLSAFVTVAPLGLALGVLLRDCEREKKPWRTVAVGAALLTLLMFRDYLQFPRSSYAAFALGEQGPVFPAGFQARMSEWVRTAQENLRHGAVPSFPAEFFFLVETGVFLVLGILVVFQGAGEVKPFAWDRPYTWLRETEGSWRATAEEEKLASGRRSVGTLLMANLSYTLAILAGVMMLGGGTALAVAGRQPAEGETPTGPVMTTVAVRVVRAITLAPVGVLLGLFGALAVWNLYAWLGRPGGPVNRWVGSRVAWVPAAAFVTALVVTQGYIPALSEHMSPRGVWAVVRQLRHPGDRVGRYGGPTDDPATRYYTLEPPSAVSSEQEAVEWLTGSSRSFLVVGTDVFGGFNRAYRAARHRNVPVVDATNSTLLVAVSDLEGRENRNPLEQWVLSERPRIRRPAREPVRLDQFLEFLGYDLDSNGMTYVPLGGSFKITFVFHVLRETPRNWQIFVHTDGAGPRINGDHEPVGGRYPVRLWQEGDYIRDQLTVQVPSTYRPGVYTVFMGFFDGSDRMRTEGGEHDHDNRVIAARVTVR